VTGYLVGLAVPVALVLLRDRRTWHLARVARWEAEAEAEHAEWVALRETDEVVSVAEAADIVGRAQSTIHGWMAAGKVRRIDKGGKGVPARLRLIDVLRAEHGVRGRGRPPASA